MTTGAPVYVHVTQRISAPPERVYDAWLDPALLGSWMFGPRFRDEELISIPVDARLGGTSRSSCCGRARSWTTPGRIWNSTDRGGWSSPGASASMARRPMTDSAG